MQQTYKELFRLLAGSFNQDWEDDHDSPDAVVEAFVADNTTEEIEKVRAQLSKLLELDLTESQMRSLLLDKYVCSYYYPSEWSSAKEWLTHLIDMLKK